MGCQGSREPVDVKIKFRRALREAWHTSLKHADIKCDWDCFGSIIEHWFSLIEVCGVSVLLNLAQWPICFPCCCSWAQQLSSSCLYYFALDLYSKSFEPSDEILAGCCLAVSEVRPRVQIFQSSFLSFWVTKLWPPFFLSSVQPLTLPSMWYAATCTYYPDALFLILPLSLACSKGWDTFLCTRHAVLCSAVSCKSFTLLHHFCSHAWNVSCMLDYATVSFVSRVRLCAL